MNAYHRDPRELLAKLPVGFLSQDTRLCELSTASGSGVPTGTLLVHKLRGWEEINLGFRYAVEALSGDAFLELNAVLASFRWRGPRPEKPAPPGTVMPLAPPPEVRTPLGTTLSSTGYCPESGIWECGHPNDRYGRRQYYQKGRPFHDAALPARRGLIGWLRRDPDELWVPTTWTLVEYRDEL